MAAKLTHYLTPDAVEFNGRRLPTEIAEYAMAGDLTERQLDDYEHILLHVEEKEEVVFNMLHEKIITKASGRYNRSGVEIIIKTGINGKTGNVDDQQDDSSILIHTNESPLNDATKNKLILPPRES